jgi:Protein of unknown function (DUF4238)
MPDAKLTHYVPRMLLRRFSTEPDAKNPRLHVLEVESGRHHLSTVGAEAAINHFNRLETPERLQGPSVEETYSLVESGAGPILARLIEGRTPSADEILLLALFVVLQHERTPRARYWSGFFDEEFATSALTNASADPDKDRVADRRAWTAIRRCPCVTTAGATVPRSGSRFLSAPTPPDMGYSPIRREAQACPHQQRYPDASER